MRELKINLECFVWKVVYSLYMYKETDIIFELKNPNQPNSKHKTCSPYPATILQIANIVQLTFNSLSSFIIFKRFLMCSLHVSRVEDSL